ncbi:MAG: calcium-binding protein [Cyanobacteria bacterium P01_H01_bin.21]
MTIKELTQKTNNLDISGATYLGGNRNDSANAVDVSKNGITVFGGALSQYNSSAKKINLLGGGEGSVVRYNNKTNKVLSVTHLPGEVDDLEVNSKGEIAVAGDFGVAVLSADGSRVIWSDNSASASQVSISDSGRVVATQGRGKIKLYNSQGKVQEEFSTGKNNRRFNDVAITDKNGGTLIATGYEQKLSNLQVAFTQAWDYSGKQKWKSYDESASKIQQANLMADTRGESIAIGDDGELYAAYSINGGTGFSIFSRDPLNFAQSSGPDTVQTDSYTRATNVGSVKMTYYGRYDLATGDLKKGQSLLTRLSSGRGNSVKPTDITADQQGNVYLVGQANASLANRDNQTIEGKKVSGYSGSEGFLAVMSPDLKNRYVWTPFVDGNANAIGVGGGVAALALTAEPGADLVTTNAVQRNAGGGDDAYLLLIGGESGSSNPTPPAPTPPTPPTPTPPTPPVPTPPSGPNQITSNNSVIRGTSRGDTINGGSKSQRIAGKKGNDTIRGKGGNDTIYGDQGADRVFGDKGKDRVFGGSGNDYVHGGSSNDYVHGGSGNDRLIGGWGNDRLVGGNGNDFLQGAWRRTAAERDVMTGGKGRDTFVLGDRSGTLYDDGKSRTTGTSNYALITDLNVKQGDMIQLSNDHDYRLGSSRVASGRGLFIDNAAGQKDELIAVIRGSGNLNLNSNTFKYV